MKRLLLVLIFSLSSSLFAGEGATNKAIARADVRNEAAVKQVLAGQREDANAAWWGFDPEDSTAALQAAIDSRAKRVLVPYMGARGLCAPLPCEVTRRLTSSPAC